MRVIIYKNRETGKIRTFQGCPDVVSNEKIHELIESWNGNDNVDAVELAEIEEGSFVEYLIYSLDKRREVDVDAIKSALYDLGHVEDVLNDLLSEVAR